MADLLEHLVLPNSSEESFHSAVEQDSSTQLPLTDSLTSAAKLARDVRANALEAAGLPVYDIDAYLSDPKNAALLASTPAHKNTPAKALQSGSDPAQPVALGSKSSHHVTALNILCQQKGLMPKYEIDGDISNADFGGLLRIGEMTIACDDRWHSKKEVREALAAKGVETFKAMETAKRKEPGTAGENRNWVGLLLGETLFFLHLNPSPVLRRISSTTFARSLPTDKR